MLQIAQKMFGSLALVLTLLASTSIEARQQPNVETTTPAAAQTRTTTDERPFVQRRIPKAGRIGALPFVRTELFFGTAKPVGVVTEEEFRTFIDLFVTPSFPDGLTIQKGDGQFRGEDNIVIKEQSFVVILLYPYETFNESSEAIQYIRELYKTQFHQESVLRVDDPFTVWVSF
jgi:hypothetical protein